VPRRIFGLRRDEMEGGLRKLHKKELHNFYTKPNVIRTTMPRRIREVGHIARMGRRGMHIGLWWESQMEKHH
jgi:hypothetical protein